MNIKFKTIFTINNINFLIIHVVVNFSENHILNMDEFFKTNGLIIDFSNADSMLVM
jgi:hypothetical protein